MYFLLKMRRFKQKQEKIIHQPNTLEIFGCLSGMPDYSKILLENISVKPYSDFLKWLITVNFFIDKEEIISIKKIAADFNTETGKVTKWLKEIYKDIFELNFDNRELFQKKGVKLQLYMKSYDNYCMFFTSMPVVPREYETIKIPFVKGVVGEDQFFVKRVEHIVEDNSVEIMLWLEAGSVNKYRQFALDKALFQGHIGFGDIYWKYAFELDKILKETYRN